MADNAHKTVPGTDLCRADRLPLKIFIGRDRFVELGDPDFAHVDAIYEKTTPSLLSDRNLRKTFEFAKRGKRGAESKGERCRVIIIV
jgi:hypothetical protein